MYLFAVRIAREDVKRSCRLLCSLSCSNYMSSIRPTSFGAPSPNRLHFILFHSEMHFGINPFSLYFPKREDIACGSLKTCWFYFYLMSLGQYFMLLFFSSSSFSYSSAFLFTLNDYSSTVLNDLEPST